MAGKNKNRINLPLLLPVAGLVIEGIVFLILVSYNVEISQSLTFFLLLIASLLLYQVVMQIIQLVKVNTAIKKSNDAKQWAESGREMDAIKEWKKQLLILPRDKYLEILDDVVNTYQKLEMKNGVQKAEHLIKSSHEFFDMINSAKKATPTARQEWQEKSNDLRKMVNELPEA
jgi:hypothetical protein